MVKILLTGARGMLGRRLAEAFSQSHKVFPSSRAGSDGTLRLDVTEIEEVRSAFQTLKPDWIVNAAAYTATDRAESEPELAWKANAQAPGILARVAQERGARILHVGTDFVFSGQKGAAYTETDAMGPRGVYASSKAAGEEAVRNAAPDAHTIVRVAWLYGADGGNFVQTMLRLGGERDVLRVVSDQRGTPTHTRDAAKTMVDILEAGLKGTVHAANSGITTWFELAQETIRLAGLKARVEPISTAEYPTLCPRPACSALKNEVLESTIGDAMRPWSEALRAYLNELGVIP
jgi:dTDP-4-dehydrorhamnose reductase